MRTPIHFAHQRLTDLHTRISDLKRVTELSEERGIDPVLILDDIAQALTDISEATQAANIKARLWSEHIQADREE